MCFINHLAQTIFCDMCIDLRGRQCFVAEQFLHDPQICSVVQKVRCKAVAYHMRMNMYRKSGFFTCALAQHLDHAYRNRFPLLIDKIRRGE